MEISISNTSYNLYLGVAQLFITITKTRRAHPSCMPNRNNILGVCRINGRLRIFNNLQHLDFIFMNDRIAIYVLIHIESCILY